MARTKRRNFTNKFKLNAIKLAKRLASNSVAARDFGCSEKNIRDWRRNEHLINAAPRGNRRRPRQNSAKFPAVDLAVCEYIDTRRQKGLGVSRALIRLEALKVARRLHINNFVASEGWCTNFMRRNNYTIRCPTKIAQKLPAHYVDKIVSFQRFVIRRRTERDYAMCQIGNMDETPIRLDMLPHRTVNKMGDKTILIKSTGHDKSRYTCVLTVMADGSKLRPMLIFPRKTAPKGNFPDEVIIHWNEKGWMDEEACKIWVHKVWEQRPGGLRRHKSLLVWDRFSAHLTESVYAAVKGVNTDMAVIPGGLTGILQPLDVSINKPFKDALRARWEQWMASESYTLTAGGNMRPPSLETHAYWVKECWEGIKIPMIVKSFKKCCISNALDGTEDDMLWEDTPDDHAHLPADIVDPDDPDDDVTDPYDDMVGSQDWAGISIDLNTADAVED